MVLDHRAHHHVVGGEAEPVGQMVEGLGGVPAEDGHIRAVRVTAGEAEHGAPGRLVRRRGPARAEACAPVHAGVPGEELVHPGHRGRMGLGRCGLVQLHRPTVGAVEARDQQAGPHQRGQRVRRVVPRGRAGRGGGGHRLTLRARRRQVRSSPWTPTWSSNPGRSRAPPRPPSTRWTGSSTGWRPPSPVWTRAPTERATSAVGPSTTPGWPSSPRPWPAPPASPADPTPTPGTAPSTGTARRSPTPGTTRGAADVDVQPAPSPWAVRAFPEV